jgi:hypothetical protein
MGDLAQVDTPFIWTLFLGKGWFLYINIILLVFSIYGGLPLAGG